MHRYLAVILVANMFWFSAQAADTIYQWVDEKGVTHFSDLPRHGATKLEVEANPPATNEPLASPRAPLNKAKKAVQYQIKITQPLDEQSIRDNQGKIHIKASATPAPNSSMSYKLVLDELPQGQLSKQADFQLTNIDRGAHTIQVQLVDDSGKLIASSDTITVFLHRAKTLATPSATGGGV